MTAMSEGPASRPAGTSLWTTPASAAAPLEEASIDSTVSADKVRAALVAARKRGGAFSTLLTEELLRKSF